LIDSELALSSDDDTCATDRQTDRQTDVDTPSLAVNHTQLALVEFSQLSAAVVRHNGNDGAVHAIRAWFKYDTALSAVV